MPVIIVSSTTSAGSAQALEALEAGAVDVMAKPAGASSAANDGVELAAKIKAAHLAHRRVPSGLVTPRVDPAALTSAAVRTQGPMVPGASVPAGPARHYSSRQIILMGASTGGTEALKQVLSGLSSTVPGICVVQHIPAYFSNAFAERLNQCCALEVREARPGDLVQPGLVLIAPGGQHLLLRRVGAHYVVELNSGPPVHHQRPAVDILFDSAVRAGAGPHALALLLTGMGADGAAGLLKLKEAGACTVAQDEESCVVFGMPKAAIRLGAAQQVLPLQAMAGFIERHSNAAALAPLGA